MDQIIKPEWRTNAQELINKCGFTEVSDDLEKTLYQHLCDLYQNYDQMNGDSDCFRKIYNARINDMCALIDPESDSYQPWLKEKLDHPDTDLKNIVAMKPWEARPDQWKDTIEEYQRAIANLGKKTEATCNLFLCTKCGKKETTYFEMQSRSCDEPMTVYITCVNCGNQWKQ